MGKYEIKKVFIGIIIFIIVFGMIYSVSAETYNFTDTITPGGAIEIPKEIEQYSAQVESYLASKGPGKKSGTAQYDVRQLWEAQNKPVADNNIAYVEVAGQKRYLVALPTTFGWSGDYVDIVLSDGETVPCLIGDSKSDSTDDPYFYNGVFYGHTYSGKCDIVEFIMGTEYGDNYSNAPTDFLGKFNKVDKIANGGSYFLHKDGPVGLDGDYKIITPGSSGGASSSIDNGSSGNNSSSDSFSRKLGHLLRRGWIAIATLFDNDNTGDNASSIMISL